MLIRSIPSAGRQALQVCSAPHPTCSRIVRRCVLARTATVDPPAEAQQPEPEAVAAPVSTSQQSNNRGRTPRPAPSDRPSPTTRRYTTPRRTSTPRIARIGSPQSGTPRAIPASLIRDDTLTLQNVSDPEQIAKDILAHPMLSGDVCTAASSSGPVQSADTLRVVALTSRDVSCALEALAIANVQLAASNVALQVSASVRRPPNMPMSDALDKGMFGAFLFVRKVPFDSLPALPSTPLKAGQQTQFVRLGWSICNELISIDAKSTLVTSVGSFATLTAFKGLMWARARLLAGDYLPRPKTAGGEGEQEAAPQPGPKERGERKDFWFIPSRADEKINSAVTLSVTRLHAVTCTPLPVRERSLSEEEATPMRSRAGERGPRGAPRAREAKADVVTVPTKEWQDMKNQLDAMVKQHQSLMALLSEKLNPQQGEPDSGSDSVTY